MRRPERRGGAAADLVCWEGSGLGARGLVLSQGSKQEAGQPDPELGAPEGLGQPAQTLEEESQHRAESTSCHPNILGVRLTGDRGWSP